MKAMLLDGDNFVWDNVADPACRQGEVVIAVKAAALNRADLLQRDGLYPPPPGWPEWPGLEVAGEIVEVSDRSRWNVGDKVCALLGGGGYAERVAVPDSMVASIPDGLDMIAAAGLPEVFATAHLNLCLEAGIKPGDTVYIAAGASGLGLAAIQLAKLAGATKVITTVSSPAKARVVSDYGADIVVNRLEGNLQDVLAKNTPDIALDCVGGPLLSANLEQMAFGGRWILIATLGGSQADLDLGVFFRKRLRLIGSTLRSRSDAEKARIIHDLETKYWPLFAEGKLRTHVHAVLPITEVDTAQAILRRNENIGKIILTIG